MNKNSNRVVVIISFLILVVLLTSNYITLNNRKERFNENSNKISNYADTTKDRIASSVITLPDGNLLVGMNNNIGYYASASEPNIGVINIDSGLLTTKFVEGVFDTKAPRLDAVVPMYVNSDSYGGSTYIVLFHDRGDAAIEKSHARLGKSGLIIESINILAPSGNIKGEEYRVSVLYKISSLLKEVIIPVVDGHFDPKGTISK